MFVEGSVADAVVDVGSRLVVAEGAFAVVGAAGAVLKIEGNAFALVESAELSEFEGEGARAGLPSAVFGGLGISEVEKGLFGDLAGGASGGFVDFLGVGSDEFGSLVFFFSGFGVGYEGAFQSGQAVDGLAETVAFVTA